MLSVLLTISPVLRVVSYADINDLMFETDSNAIMTLSLDDTDYSTSLMSSVGTVTNTIDWSNTFLQIYLYNVNTSQSRYINFQITDFDDSGAEFRFDMENQTIYKASDGWQIAAYGFILYKNNLPSSGSYAFSMDIGSSFSFDYDNFRLVCSNDVSNASTATATLEPSFIFSSGDLYVAPYNISLTNLDRMILRAYIHGEGQVYVDGSVHVCFSPVASGDYPSTGVVDTTQSEVDSQISNSLSDISSSVDSVVEEVGIVAQAIQTLQGAMEPHYDNVLTQLHHITEQLHAFYDQIYNNIHLKEYALWQDIKTAIENIDLEVNVNLDKLKTSIDNMSTAIQNKLQSVQDTITNGFDNAAINEDAAALDQQLSEYEDAEQNVLDQVNDSLNNFEFDSGFEEYQTTIQVFSQFLQDLYDSSGGFKIVINLSLMLSIAGVVIGIYRFRG